MYTKYMNIDFQDKQNLHLMETGQSAETALSVPIIKACRKKLGFIRSAKDERDFRNWKSLHYEKLIGDKEGKHSIKLNDQWRLVFEINNDYTPPLITILSVEDYH